MEPSPYPIASRRAVIAGGAGAALLGLTGCSLNDPFDDEKTPAADAVRDLAPDVAVAVEAVTRIRATQSVLDELVATRPAFGTRLAGLQAMHRAHLEVLVDAVPDRVDTSPAPSATPSATPSKSPSTLAFARSAERGLHDTLIGLAVRAESGPFARLLGAMAAAISQQLAVLR